MSYSGHGSHFEALADRHQTRETYSATAKFKARDAVRTVFAFAPHRVIVGFFSMLFPDSTFVLVLRMCFRGKRRVQGDA